MPRFVCHLFFDHCKRIFLAINEPHLYDEQEWSANGLYSGRKLLGARITSALFDEFLSPDDMVSAASVRLSERTSAPEIVR